jgi:hypothetical protein
MGTGRPRFFDVDVYLSAVEHMINADEVERAFHMLDNMPAYYREHPPKRAAEIRESLNRQLFTPVQYKGIYDGAAIDHATMPWPMRAQKLEELVRESVIVPHIMELAPGGHWIAEGLRHRGLDFTYESLGLDAGDWADASKGDGPAIFCAFEIIEHLANEQEIYQNYLKFNRPADVVMISTPLYTYAGGMDEWRERALGHLRTYTPTELHAVVARMFQGFDWHCYLDDTILLKGVRK